MNPAVVTPKAPEDDIRDEQIKLELKWGYQQLELTPESRGTATFAVYTGTFRYNKHIFGVSSASEQYQHETAMALAGIEGVENISDDMTVHRPQTRRLHAVLNRLESCGLTLNLKVSINIDKLIHACQFFFHTTLTERHRSHC